MKNKEKLTCFGLSDMGKQRTNNEDAFIAEQLDEKSILAVVIDGVGGYEGGEVAAEIARTEIPNYLHEFRNGERLELLKQAVVCANNAIFSHRQIDTERSSMSCVLTSAIIDANRKVIDMVHVGDTRLYQYQNKLFTKLSHDHSLIGYREEIGDLTEEQAMCHPQRNIISRDVGSAKHEVEDRDFIEATEFPLLPNSILLLCSDGLTDLVTSKQICSILSQKTSLESKAKSLITAANEAGGKDNITVVLVEYQAEEKNHNAIGDTNVQEISNVNPNQASDYKEKVTDEKKEAPSKNKNFNIYFAIAIAVILLISIFAFIYTYNVNKKLTELENKFDNHLLFSEQEEIRYENNDTIETSTIEKDIQLVDSHTITK